MNMKKILLSVAMIGGVATQAMATAQQRAEAFLRAADEETIRVVLVNAGKSDLLKDIPDAVAAVVEERTTTQPAPPPFEVSIANSAAGDHLRERVSVSSATQPGGAIRDHMACQAFNRASQRGKIAIVEAGLADEAIKAAVSHRFATSALPPTRPDVPDTDFEVVSHDDVH